MRFVGPRHWHETLTPTGRKGIDYGITHDVRMIAMAQIVGAVFTKSLMPHHGDQFIKGIRVKVGIEGGGQGPLVFSQLGKRCQQG